MIRLVAVALLAALAACRPEIRNPHRFCHADDECSAGENCIANQCQCHGVRGTDTCRVAGTVCVDGACVPCTASGQCPDNTCCAKATGRCVAPRWDEIRPVTADRPAPRYQHAAILDADNDRMLVFGGNSDRNTLRADLWELRLGESPMWVPLDLDRRPTKRSAVGAAVDPVRRRALFVEGYLESNGEPPIAALDLAKVPAWIDATVAPGPDLRHSPSFVWDPKRGRFLLFGGYPPSNTEGRNDVWALAPDPLAWTNLLPNDKTGQPSPRAQSSAVYDPVNDELVVFGGVDRSTFFDLWALSLAATPPSWREVQTTNPAPRSTSGSTMILEPSMRRLVVFGGLHYESNAVYDNDVYTLALTSPGTRPTWTPLVPQGTPPPGRVQHTAVWDQKREQMIVFGGRWNEDAPRSDAYTLSLPACF